MGQNGATSTAFQMDFFTAPSTAAARRFWDSCDTADLGGDSFTARRGNDFAASIDLIHKDGKWTGFWSLGAGRFGRDGQTKPLAYRDFALSAAGDGLLQDSGRLNLTKRSRTEIRRWLAGLGAL